MLDATSTEPIYQQIANWLEDEILLGHLTEDAKVYSQYQLAELFQVNPATAGKAITLLLEQDLVYKKRGLGTFVKEGAQQQLKMNRKTTVIQTIIDDLVEQAKLLGLTEHDVQQAIQASFQKEEKK